MSCVDTFIKCNSFFDTKVLQEIFLTKFYILRREDLIYVIYNDAFDMV